MLIAIIPAVFLLYRTEVGHILIWVSVLKMLTTVKALYAAFCAPCVCGLILSIYWARLSKLALIVGHMCSTLSSVLVWVLLEYLVTLQISSQLVSVVTAFVGGFICPIIFTLLFTKRLSPEDTRRAWVSVQEIDNPLVPWPEIYSR